LDIDCVGERTQKRYVGQFEVKLFTAIKDKAEASRLKSKLLKDISDTDTMYYILSLLADLTVHLIKKPDWFGEDGTDLEDNEPIIALATALREAQELAVKPVKPEEKEAPKKEKK
jgi:hypothetical protein